MEHQLLHGAAVQTLGLPGGSVEGGDDGQVTGVSAVSGTEQPGRDQEVAPERLVWALTLVDHQLVLFKL